MVGTFLRHGSNIWLTLGLAALMVGFTSPASCRSLCSGSLSAP